VTARPDPLIHPIARLSICGLLAAGADWRTVRKICGIPEQAGGDPDPGGQHLRSERDPVRGDPGGIGIGAAGHYRGGRLIGIGQQRARCFGLLPGGGRWT
jgi:hypothetical protein